MRRFAFCTDRAVCVSTSACWQVASGGLLFAYITDMRRVFAVARASSFVSFAGACGPAPNASFEWVRFRPSGELLFAYITDMRRVFAVARVSSFVSFVGACGPAPNASFEWGRFRLSDGLNGGQQQ